MNQQNDIQRIIELLARWLAKIRLNTAINFYDINKASEDLSMNLLNLIFDYQLVDLNIEKKNYPGIDLGDKVNKIAFQITSRTDSHKIQENLNSFIKNGLDKIYSNGIRFLILNTEKVKFGLVNYQKIYPNFNKYLDVIYDTDLIRHINTIRSKDKDRFDKIKNLLESEFGHNDVSNNEFIRSIFSIEDESYLINDGESKINIFKDIVPKYLISKKDRYIETKTFLSSNKHHFYDVYFPTSVKIYSQYDNFDEKITVDNIKKLFKKSNFITIFGAAGSGKSMLMTHLFLNAIETYFGIPIIIELRHLNDFQGSLINFISKNIFYNKIKDDKILDSLLNKGNLIFLLDGYDELFSDNKQKRINEIEAFIDSYNTNKYIITSRPGTTIKRLNRFLNVYVSELNDIEIKGFIKKQNNNDELSERIIETIHKPENKNYLNYLSNPLLLSMFILNFTYHPELPKKKSSFYSDVFDTLYQRHDGESKSGFPREKVSKLEKDEFVLILQRFSALSYFQGKLDFDIHYINDLFNEIKKITKLVFNNDKVVEDLEISLSIFIKDGLEYRFPHRSLQEYFLALFIKQLPESHKEKFYNSKFDKLKKITTDNFLNIWELCFELDSRHFNKYFVIPQLKEIVNKINESTSQTFYDTLIETFNTQIFFVQESNSTINLFNTKSTFYDTYITLLSFIKLDNLDLDYFERILNKYAKLFISYAIPYNYSDDTYTGLDSEESIKYSIDLYKIRNQQEIKNLLEYTGLIDTWKQIYKKSKDKLIELNKELESDDENIDLILRMI